MSSSSHCNKCKKSKKCNSLPQWLRGNSVQTEAVFQVLYDAQVYGRNLKNPVEAIQNLQPANISFANGASVNFGNGLTTPNSIPSGSQVTLPPNSISFPSPKSKSKSCAPPNSGLYTVVMLDLDAKDRSTKQVSPLLHWMIANVPATQSGDVTTLNLLGGTTVAQWFVPGPPINAGFHRYTFLVFAQASVVTTTGIPAFGTNSQGRWYYGFMDTFFSVYFNGISFSLTAVNWFCVLNLDPTKANFNGPSPPFLLTTISGGQVTGLTNLAGSPVSSTSPQGNGYLPAPAAPPTITVTNAPGDTTGSGAAITATVNTTGQLLMTISNPGSGYTLPPIISIPPPPLFQAEI